MGCGGSKAAGGSNDGSIQLTKDQGASSVTTQAMAKVHGASENVRIEDLYSGVPFGGRDDGECMGSGGTASVYKVVQKATGKEFALKVVSLGHVGKEQGNKDMLLREIGLIKLLDHPNIVKVFEVFQTVTVLYIVMELCTGGELFDKLYEQPGEKFSEADAHYLAKKMIGSLAYLHTNGVVHRDLKLENFIFTDTTKDAEVKLIDFGFSRRYRKGAEIMTNSIGTCYYMAPEVIKEHYTNAADLWSVGVVIFMMVTGQVPFGGNENAEIIEGIIDASADPDKMKDRLNRIMVKAKLSPECIKCILGLLTVNIDKRLTAAQCLEQPWIKMDAKDIRGRRQTMGVDNTTAEQEAVASDDLVRKLKKFRDTSKLKRSALMAVSFGLTSTELKQLAKQFSDMDKNSDGIITYAEFTDQMTNLGMDTAEIKQAFTAIDQDQTGIIKYSEFIAAAIDEKEFDEDHEVEAAFRRLDLDESGELDVDDLRKLLPAGLSEDAINRILDQADFHKDGKIDLNEFKMVMQGKIAV